MTIFETFEISIRGTPKAKTNITNRLSVIFYTWYHPLSVDFSDFTKIPGHFEDAENHGQNQTERPAIARSKEKIRPYRMEFLSVFIGREIR